MYYIYVDSVNTLAENSSNFLYDPTTNRLTIIGQLFLEDNSTNHNTAIGINALLNVINGSWNIALEGSALHTIINRNWYKIYRVWKYRNWK